MLIITLSVTENKLRKNIALLVIAMERFERSALPLLDGFTVQGSNFAVYIRFIFPYQSLLGL